MAHYAVMCGRRSFCYERRRNKEVDRRGREETNGGQTQTERQTSSSSIFRNRHHETRIFLPNFSRNQATFLFISLTLNTPARGQRPIFTFDGSTPPGAESTHTTGSRALQKEGSTGASLLLYAVLLCFSPESFLPSQSSHTCHPKSEATMLVCHHDVSGSHAGASTGVVALIRGTYFQTYILVVIVVIVPLTACHVLRSVCWQ
jgi:hypothetical protein